MPLSGATVAHIGIAVRDLDEALRFYQAVLRVRPTSTEHADGSTIACLPFGDLFVELLCPSEPDSPVGRFLASRGPGLHHICYRVADLEAALQACREAGYQLVDQEPRVGVGGRAIAFLHPRSAQGTLIELTE